MLTRTARLALTVSLLFGLLMVAPAGAADPTTTVVVQPGQSLVDFLWLYGVSGSRMVALNFVEMLRHLPGIAGTSVSRQP